MMSIIISILSWAFPAGLSVLNLFFWRDYRKQKKSEITASTVEIWKKIAESNNKALLEYHKTVLENNEKILEIQLSMQELRARTKKFERILGKIEICSYYDSCPVRNCVQEYKAKYVNIVD